MKKTNFFMLCAAFASLIGYAHNDERGLKISAQGESTINIPHEYVDFYVSVHTRCGTAVEVEEQNRAQVAQVVAFLTSVMKESGLSTTDNNWVRTLPSSGLKDYRDRIYVDNNPVELCGGTFQQTTEINFRTTAKDEVFNQINRRYVVDLKDFMVSSGVRDSLTTVINAEGARAGICDETRQITTRLAEIKAWDNLLGQIYRSADACGFNEQHVRFVSINWSNNRSLESTGSYAPAAFKMDESAEATPVYLAPIGVTAYVSVEALGPETYCQHRGARSAMGN